MPSAENSGRPSPLSLGNDSTTRPEPLVTFVLFAYNQEKYICEAVNSALAQTYEPMEIIISDDCSSDNTFSHILNITDMYRGPHQVIARRNNSNLGFASHISTVMRLVSGDLIISADGDDISYPNRTSKIVEQWKNNDNESGSILSLYDAISFNKRILANPSKRPSLRYAIKDRNQEIVKACSVGTLGCTLAWTKDVFQVFGDLDSRSIHQDITIPLRSLMIGSVTFIQEPLVLYRLLDNTLSRVSYKNSVDRSLKMKRYWAARIANYEQFDRDLRIALALEMVELDDANWMQLIVDKEREMAVLNHAFLSSNTLVQVKAILASSRNILIRRKIKLLLLALFPWLYNASAAKVKSFIGTLLRF
jgi:glycosyltransferase involved in cell wall biosynthesis